MVDHTAESMAVDDISAPDFDSNALVEAESLMRRAGFAKMLTQVMRFGLGPMVPIIGIIWLLDTQYTQLLLFALIIAQATVGTQLYQVLHRRNKVIAGMNIFIVTCLILLAACPILIPDTMLASGIGFVVMISIGTLLLGKKGNRWLIVASVVLFLADLIVVTFITPDWFTPLSDEVNRVVSSATAIAAFLIAVSTLVLIVAGQEDQFWQAQMASLELEQRMTEELEQREQLTQANLEIEQRAAIERQQSDQLRALTMQILDTASQLNASATELQATITQLTASATEQNAVVTQVAATVEQVRVTVSQTAERAQNVANASQESMSVSNTGNQVISETIDGMTLIGQQVEDIAETILLLSERTQQIGEIIETVNGLADQSKLLALNASIEAARAGEEGKGFAVVAMEVRQLAEQSREATARVRDILSDIQNATNTAVMVTEQGSKGAAEGMNLAERAGTVIEDLASTVETAANTSEQIATSTRQQTTGVEQLATAMSQIKQTSSQNAVAMKQAEQSVRDLQIMASQLQEVAGRYEVAEGVIGST